MADDKTSRTPQDAARINVHQAHEIRYWTGKFDCSAEQLESAVKAVGVMAKDVEAHLAKPAR